MTSPVFSQGCCARRTSLLTRLTVIFFFLSSDYIVTSTNSYHSEIAPCLLLSQERTHSTRQNSQVLACVRATNGTRSTLFLSILHILPLIKQRIQLLESHSPDTTCQPVTAQTNTQLAQPNHHDQSGTLGSCSSQPNGFCTQHYAHSELCRTVLL